MIEIRLDRATQTLIGTETIKVHDNGSETLSQIELKLDQNICRARVPLGGSVPAETTEGMVLTRIVVDGTRGSVSIIDEEPR